MRKKITTIHEVVGVGNWINKIESNDYRIRNCSCSGAPIFCLRMYAKNPPFEHNRFKMKNVIFSNEIHRTSNWSSFSQAFLLLSTKNDRNTKLFFLSQMPRMSIVFRHNLHNQNNRAFRSVLCLLYFPLSLHLSPCLRLSFFCAFVMCVFLWGLHRNRCMG